MHKEDSVYDYIINSINNIITNGISYYSDKDIDKINHLMDIYDYINGNIDTIIDIDTEEELDIADDKIEELSKFDNIIQINDQIAEQVKRLTDDFMNKMTDIKINILNLENDLSLYYDSTSDDVIKEVEIRSEITDEPFYVVTDNSVDESGEESKLDDELLSVNTIKVKDLSIDNDSVEVNDILNSDETILVDNDSSIQEVHSSYSSDEENDLSSETLVLESKNDEKIEDDNLIALDEEVTSDNKNLEESIDDVEPDDKPRRHSILDLFRKKNG